MIDELINRAIHFFRIGMEPYGELSFLGYIRHAERKIQQDETFAMAAIHAIERGDYLCAADILERDCAPLYVREGHALPPIVVEIQ